VHLYFALSSLTFSFSFITIPFLANDPKAIEVVQIILESILLRREKTMTDVDGKRIVELPNKEVSLPQALLCVFHSQIPGNCGGARIFTSGEKDI
jgi:hypothetical protein